MRSAVVFYLKIIKLPLIIVYNPLLFNVFKFISGRVIVSIAPAI
jgi:hypothetical protein